MYVRYEIETRETPPVRAVPNKFYPVVSRLRLAAMLVREAIHYRFRPGVIFSRPCIYGVFSGPVGGFLPRRHLCVGCMRCVLEYPDVCQVLIDQEWQALGDAYFTPDAISTLNYEATTGRIAVKGVGYKGPFAGPGFDSMWTDMSEIVRPTRDGIYGREYISTAVDVGRKPLRYAPAAGSAGAAEPGAEPLLELPLPFVFDRVPAALAGSGVEAALVEAARRLRTLCLVPWERLDAPGAAVPAGAVVPVVGPDGLDRALAALRGRPFPALVCAEPGPSDLPRLRVACPAPVPVARLPLGPDTDNRVFDLVEAGWGSFLLAADYHGAAADGTFVKDAVRRVHERLIAEGCREEVTLVVAGGIVRAEHVPKAILSGADLVALDTAAWVALGAEFRGEYRRPEDGTLDLPPVGRGWGTQRVVNFCASWRDQLLEILSAMGLREVRRLRGELGRAMACAELEQEAFGDLERA